MECSEWSRSKENQILGYLVKSRGPENLFWSNYELFMFLKACNGRGTQGSWPIGPRVGRCGWVTQKSKNKIKKISVGNAWKWCWGDVLGVFRRNFIIFCDFVTYSAPGHVQ